ncbi:MAG: DUF4351 domain-containing protein [Acidobacteria bacterium]|nr:MAG: DUF4351 domain-containing protein [Acidobacteriota bacterium]GIU83182.1 MAG: hypothetical protein KatS3mg006_2246 [Pyrinomonadaceae bacterium]
MTELFEQSPLYQKIVQEAIQQGVQQGIEKGIEQGIEQGEQRLLIKQLTALFGELDAELLERIDTLTLEQIEQMAEAIFQFRSLEDVRKWIESIENSQKN